MSWEDGAPYVDELAPGAYAYVQPDGGWMVNNCGTILDASGRAVLVDTSSTERRTRAVLAEVAKVSEGAPRMLVNTHHHPDHTFGNGFLPPQTLVVGHDRCREEILAAGLEATRVITEPDYGDLVLRPPELTFSERMTIHADDVRIELQHVGPAHTSNDVVVWLPERSVLFAGDVAFCGGQPFCVDGSIAGFRRALGHIRDLAPRVLVPGHGPVVRGDAVASLLDDLEDYLVFVQEVAARGRAQGWTPLEAATRHRENRFSTWAETERLVGNLHRAYDEDAGGPADPSIGAPSVWPDMVAFNGGPIGCHA